MSFSLFVRCNCIKNRTFKPIPEEIKHYVYFEEGDFHFKFPEEIDENLSSEDYIKINFKYRKEIELFNQWKDNVCEHGNDFRAAQRYIRVFDRAQFRHILNLLGCTNFTFLLLFMNKLEEYGSISSTESKYLLEEINLFKKLLQTEDLLEVDLIDVANNYVIRSTVEDYADIVDINDNYKFEFNKHGFFVKRNKRNKVLFQSKDFRQENISSEKSDVIDQKILFTDNYSKKKFFADDCISYYDERINAQSKFVMPAHIKVLTKKLLPEYFSFILPELINVFEVSIVTGNPVHIG